MHVHWKYKNTFLLLLSLVTLLIFARTPLLDHFVEHFVGLGYWGAFVIGIFFVSVFTVAPATVVLIYLSREYNPALVAVCATFGSLLGDYIIMRFLKDGVYEELQPLIEAKIGKRAIKRIMHTPYFSWLLPVLGAIIIASPLPDELGIALLGLSNVKTWQFLAISFFLNLVGMFALVATATLLVS